MKTSELLEHVLEELQSIKQTSLIASKEILSLQEACDFLGVAKPTMYAWTSGMEIPYFKRGKICFFKKSELIEWATEHPLGNRP